MWLSVRRCWGTGLQLDQRHRADAGFRRSFGRPSAIDQRRALRALLRRLLSCVGLFVRGSLMAASVVGLPQSSSDAPFGPCSAVGLTRCSHLSASWCPARDGDLSWSASRNRPATRPPGLGFARCSHASTHVSLVPPPCDEFTTSEPSRSATRVSPPGTRSISVPDRT